QRGNGLRIRRGCKDHVSAPTFLQFRYDVCSARVDVMMRAEFSRQRLFVVPSVDRDCFESHPPRVLNAEVSKSADALHGDHLARSRARIPKRVENRNARAHERTRFLSGQFIWNRSQHCRRRNHVLGVPTVEVKPRDLSIDAHGEITAPAQVAYETVSAMPADADTLTFLPGSNTVTECI